MPPRSSFPSRPDRRFRILSRPSRPAFTLIELLVAMAVMMILLLILLSTLGETGKVWQRSRDKVGAFQSARLAYERIVRTLGQSTLNVYTGYDDPSKPTAHIRKSDLHFVIDPPPVANFGQGNAVFFQAPLGKTSDPSSFAGLSETLNALGYYVTYGEDPNLPAFLKAFDRNRFRLMQFLDPSEELAVYKTTSKNWFTDSLDDHSTVLANDVILLLVWPRISSEEDPQGTALTTDYRYDSRLPAAPAAQAITTNQQPPLVQVTLVAIDEKSALRLEQGGTPPAKITQALSGLFQTSSEAAYKNDLSTLESRLNAAGIGYRIFSSVLPLRESKWSKNNS